MLHLIGLLAAAPVGAAVLVFAARHVLRRGRAASPLAVGWLTLSALLLVAYGLKRWTLGPVHAVWVALVPPGVLLDPALRGQGDWLAAAALPAAVAGGAAFALASSRPRWRALCVAAALVAAALAGSVAVERRSRAAMCEAAAALGRAEFARRTVWSSWIVAPQDFAFDLHAGWREGDRLWAWSYAERAFYEVPPSARGNVDLPARSVACP